MAVAPVAVFWTDAGGSITYANDAAARLLGYDRLELSRMRLSDFAFNVISRDASDPEEPGFRGAGVARKPSGSRLLPRFMLELVRRDGPMRLESELRRRDGSLLPVELFLSVAPVTEEGKEYLSCYVADQSARRDIEKRRQENDERYRSLVELSPDGIVIHTDGKIVFVNPAAIRLLGASGSMEQFLGRSVLEFVPPDLRPFVRERINRVTDDGEDAALTEEIFMRVDGRPLPVEVAGTHIQFRGKSSVMVLFRDITDRIKTQSLLVRSEALLAEAQSIARIGSWEWVVEADRWTLTEELYRLYDLDRDIELSNRLILETMPPDDAENVRRVFTEAMEGERTEFGYAHRMEMADGRVRYLQGFSRIERNSRGEAVRLTGTVQDVTERRMAEEEARRLNDELEARVQARTSELETANKELESFSYSVSHDLRAPLRAIDGFSRALEEDFADRLEPDARDYLLRIRSGCKRMARLIDSLLDLSRLTRRELRVKQVNLSELVTDIMVHLDRQERLRFEIAPDILAYCDERLMRVALENLLGNAVKYSARKEDPLVEFGAEETPAGTLFFVRDNGVGFDMMQAGRLFGVFQRLHREDEFPGTGIGLATVQRIIHRHRGTIRAVALPDEGATFYFTLGILDDQMVD